MLNPITKSVRYLAFYFSFWLVIALIQAAVFFFLLSFALIPSILDALVFNLTLAVIFIAIWPIVNYSSLDRTYLVNTVVSHFAGATVLIGISIAISWKVLGYVVNNDPSYSSFLEESLLWRAALGSIFYLLMALNLYVLIYNEEFKTRKVSEAELKQSLKEAELNILKSQLNPHFIFNSLNSISSLTLTNPEKAQEMIISLSEFLRYSVKPNQEELISVKSELSAVNRFIEIEKVRFGERLQVKIDCPQDCNELLLPPLIIQPLVENAIKYGVHENIHEGNISITCTCTNSILEIIVKNNFDPEGVPLLKTGIGLKNVRNRLNLLYGSAEMIQIEKQDLTFTIKLYIPQIKKSI